jgi:hypothetical protein
LHTVHDAIGSIYPKGQPVKDKQRESVIYAVGRWNSRTRDCEFFSSLRTGIGEVQFFDGIEFDTTSDAGMLTAVLKAVDCAEHGIPIRIITATKQCMKLNHPLTANKWIKGEIQRTAAGKGIELRWQHAAGKGDHVAKMANGV